MLSWAHKDVILYMNLGKVDPNCFLIGTSDSGRRSASAPKLLMFTSWWSNVHF